MLAIAVSRSVRNVGSVMPLSGVGVLPGADGHVAGWSRAGGILDRILDRRARVQLELASRLAHAALLHLSGSSQPVARDPAERAPQPVAVVVRAIGVLEGAGLHRDGQDASSPHEGRAGGFAHRDRLGAGREAEDAEQPQERGGHGGVVPASHGVDPRAVDRRRERARVAVPDPQNHVAGSALPVLRSRLTVPPRYEFSAGVVPRRLADAAAPPQQESSKPSLPAPARAAASMDLWSSASTLAK